MDQFSVNICCRALRVTHRTKVVAYHMENNLLSLLSFIF